MTVYVFEAEIDGRKAFKIGYTSGSAKKRLHSVKTASASDVSLLFSVDGSVGLEKALHAEFDAKRIRGEWFALDANDLSLIQSGAISPLDEKASFAPPTEEDEFGADIVRETRFYLNELVKREWLGIGDSVESARDRVAMSVDISASYLFRLWNKPSELNDVSGQAYRQLRLAYATSLKSEGRLNSFQGKFIESLERAARLPAPEIRGE